MPDVTLTRSSAAMGWQVGSGQFGKVVQAKNVVTGELSAVKIVNKTKMDTHELQNEVDMQRRLDHPHVREWHLWFALATNDNGDKDWRI